jgi:hypothetical protein
MSRRFRPCSSFCSSIQAPASALHLIGDTAGAPSQRPTMAILAAEVTASGLAQYVAQCLANLGVTLAASASRGSASLRQRSILPWAAVGGAGAPA